MRVGAASARAGGTHDRGRAHAPLFLGHARRRVAAFSAFAPAWCWGCGYILDHFPGECSTGKAGLGTGHCSPGLDMERRWCGMGGSGTGTSSAQPRRIVLGGAWRATARGRTLGRRRFGTEALARAAHAAAPLRGLTARAVAAACTMVPSDACAAHWTRVAGAPRRPGCGTRVGASMGYSAGTRRAPHTRATLSAQTSHHTQAEVVVNAAGDRV